MSKYCLSVDGAGVGTLTPNACPATGPGKPIPFKYILGPKSTDAGAVPYCAYTYQNKVQSFTKGACASEGPNQFTFYTYGSQVAGQNPLCFMPPALTGVKGTVVTTLPNQSNACTLNLFVNYQDVTCNEVGCGDHGSCVNNVCVCTDNWSGNQCQTPPTGNAGCTPDTATKKSCGNQGSYGTCQASTSSTNGIAGSGQCKCDMLTSQMGTFCEQACDPGDTTACGGPLRGACVNSFYKIYTNPNAVANRCVCINGWSGTDCTTPPAGWQCNNTDQQCTNVTTEDPKNTVVTGTCNNGTCECYNTLTCNAAVNSTSPAFTGTACQLPLSASGAPCSTPADCNNQQTCVAGTCTCPGGNTPQPSSNFVINILKGIISMFTTSDGIESFLMTIGIQAGLPMIMKYLAVRAIEPTFAKNIEARLLKATEGKVLGPEAAKVLEDSVGKRLAAKMIAKMTAKELMETSVDTAARSAAKLALESSFGFLGPIDLFVNIAGVLGMVLDANDVAGTQEQMTQSQIDTWILKSYAKVNNDKVTLQYGSYFPAKQNVETTFQFRQLTTTDASRNQFVADVSSYMSHLTVNSNNDAIIPLFQTPQQVQAAQLLAGAQKDILYAIAGKNLEVYQRLKDYWPIVVASALLLIGALIGGAFGIKALLKKKSVAKSIKS
jgi:hypothetical protein